MVQKRQPACLQLPALPLGHLIQLAPVFLQVCPCRQRLSNAGMVLRDAFLGEVSLFEFVSGFAKWQRERSE